MIHQTDQTREMAKEIRETICHISGRVNTQMKSLVDAYLPCLSPSAFVNRGFPRSVRAHGSSPLRSLSGRAADLILFVVANAILAYHALLKGPPLEDTGERMRQLRRLRTELGSLVAYGSEATGYALMTREEIKAFEAARKTKGKHAVSNAVETEELGGLVDQGRNSGRNGPPPMANQRKR